MVNKNLWEKSHLYLNKMRFLVNWSNKWLVPKRKLKILSVKRPSNLWLRNRIRSLKSIKSMKSMKSIKNWSNNWPWMLTLRMLTLKKSLKNCKDRPHSRCFLRKRPWIRKFKWHWSSNWPKIKRICSNNPQCNRLMWKRRLKKSKIL